ncbi:hypothetical protein D9613_010302 [Agrocybe pediades]|uniref:alpha-1,2-Mannosidase n=1 Tax=Agrocybe pediades TaxID=84607 RepID=A0A8H4QG36_9AGAR|nr:hypothetical protein D9613_010302 [Agrocybe pediades]
MLPPPATESLSRLAKPSNPFTKSITRWFGLGCIVVFVLWVAGPYVGSIGWVPAEVDYYPPLSQNTNTSQESTQVDNELIWDARKEEVREAFKHAWAGYKNRAMPNDELLAVSGGYSNKYNGWGVTLFDSLDTMWIMGLRKEFDEAVESIKDLHFRPTKPNHYAPFFETTIRYLGGILSAYALSGNEVLFRLADEMGQLLIPAFDGTESGLPAYSVHVETGTVLADAGKTTVLFSEATSCQLEFKYLSKITGKKEYYERVQAAMDVFYRANVPDGLFHENWSFKDGKPTGSHFTIGANADSGYEYMIKQWLQSGDVKAKDQYLKSMNGIINNLIYVTPNRGLMYVGDMDHGSMVHRLEHLSCYLPGVLALGAHVLPRNDPSFPDDVRELHQWAAHGLAYTCAVSYLDQKNGMGADILHMSSSGRLWINELNKWKREGRVGKPPGVTDPPAERDPGKRDYFNNFPNAYLLRPETVESIFVLWRTTGDVQWRERGYAIFKAINEHTRTEYGFSPIHGVDGSITHLDDMPSWFLAETLKYLYLLFDDVHSITSDHWVFNTEAHPLPIFEWTEAEKKAFTIP